MSYLTLEQLGNFINEGHFNFDHQIERLKNEPNYALAIMIYNELKSHSVIDIEAYKTKRWHHSFFDMQNKCPFITLALLEKGAFQSKFSKEVLYLFSKRTELENELGSNFIDYFLYVNDNYNRKEKYYKDYCFSPILEPIFSKATQSTIVAEIFVEFTQKFFNKDLKNALINQILKYPLDANSIHLISKTPLDIFSLKPSLLERLIVSDSSFYGDEKPRKIKLNNLILFLKLGLDCNPNIKGAKNWRQQSDTFLEMLLDKNWGKEETIELLSLKSNWQITDKSNELIKKHPQDVIKAYKEMIILNEKNNLDNLLSDKSNKSKKIKI